MSHYVKCWLAEKIGGNMKKKFLTILTVMLAILIAIVAFACTDYVTPTDEDDESDTITRTQLVTNGTFYNASSSTKDAYVNETVSGWTATRGSTALGANGVTMGVIDLNNTEAYNLNKDKFAYDDTAKPFNNPGIDKKTPFEKDDNGNLTEERQDTNALVIASRATAGSIYYKNSSSYTLQAGKYYRLQYSLVTNIDYTDVPDGDKDKKGAWVEIINGVNYVQSCIDTEGQWQTYYLYIEANKTATISLDIRLWLGHGPAKVGDSENVYSTRGAVMFDNIICEEIDKLQDSRNGGNVVDANHENFAGIAVHAESEGLKSDSDSLYYRSDFASAYYLTDLALTQTTETSPTSTNATKYFYSFREGVYTSTNVNNYTLVKGKNGVDSSETPTVTNAYTGIVDLSKLYTDSDKEKNTYQSLLPSSYTFDAPSYDDWKNKIMSAEHLKGDAKALMIYHNDLSAAGFVNKKTLTIERDKLYVISVKVYVWAPEGNNGIEWPKANAPKEPTHYTNEQAIIVEYYNSGIISVAELTKDEQSTVDAGSPELAAERVNLIKDLVESDAFKTVMQEYFAVSGKNESGEDLVYSETVASNFTYQYLNEHIEDFSIEGGWTDADKAYVNYSALKEKSTFLTGTWKTVKKAIDAHDEYDDELAEYESKYLVWSNSNLGVPKAKVKLTGAGDDIEKETSTFNEGWEELTFYIHGNQLSDRKLTLEFWFGEGSSTEYENLMFGGAFFDNISITEAKEAGDIIDWTVLSPLTKESELAFGGLIGDVQSEILWKETLAENTAQGDVDYVKVNVKRNEDFGSVDLGDQNVVELNELQYEHTQPTASVLEYTGEKLAIKPNTAYRFAMWVKTTGIADGKGVDIALLGGKKGEELSSVSTVSAFNNEEWQEVVFYVLGDSIVENEVSLKLTFGSGDRFSTDSYLKGQINIAVINVTEIKYSEYNSSSKSGDKIQSYAFSNTSTASDSVTNGSFSSIDYANTESDEFDKETGALTGVAKPSSWTVGTAKNNSFDTVELKKKDGVGAEQYRLYWAGVSGLDYNGVKTEPTTYEVYARFIEKDENGKEQSVERLIAKVNAADESAKDGDDYFVDVDLNGKKATNFRVRAVSDNAISAYSNSVLLGSSANNSVFVEEVDEVEGKKEYTIGAVDNAGLFDNSDYKSPYKTALRIRSNYNIALGMTASSKSLNSGSRYRVSVWVMTLDGATASVTVSNISNVLTADVDKNYIGYVGIDTEGKWVQYQFIIETGASSSSMKLELNLGNPYAIKAPKKTSNSSSTSIYKGSDLSMGTVYFDGVSVEELDEKAYNAELEKGEYKEDGSVKLHDFTYHYGTDAALFNQYAIRNLIYTVDSFDSFTENTTAEGSNGYNLGHTPNNYDWSKASDATGTTETERLYGVYNAQNDDIEKLRELYRVSDDDKDEDAVNVFKEFTPEDFEDRIADFVRMDGYNSLVMSNKKAFGQSYTTTSSSTINANSYYKISFKAKTLLAREEKGDDDKTTYKTDKVNAEFRFMQNGSTDKYQSILVNSKTNSDDPYEAVEYVMYIYNPSSSSNSAKWAFYLGANADDEDKTDTKKLILGMMVIDQVSLEKITETEYNEAKAATGYDDLSADDKVKATSQFYSYDKDKDSNGGDDNEEPGNEEQPKQSIWDRGEVWLLISSLVIAVAIIVVVVVVLVRRWKKKHPKEVVGENVVKTESEIKVVTMAQDKVDVTEDDEYSDVKPIVYNQRVLPKKNKKKKKK